MALSAAAMIVTFGYLPPVAGVLQEGIDVAVILSAFGRCDREPQSMFGF